MAANAVPVPMTAQVQAIDVAPAQGQRGRTGAMGLHLKVIDVAQVREANVRTEATELRPKAIDDELARAVSGRLGTTAHRLKVTDVARDPVDRASSAARTTLPILVPEGEARNKTATNPAAHVRHDSVLPASRLMATSSMAAMRSGNRCEPESANIDACSLQKVFVKTTGSPKQSNLPGHWTCCWSAYRA